MPEILAYGVKSATDRVSPMKINRRNLDDHDVAIEILYCGVCHTDIHLTRNDWGVSSYPMVPGHEIVGVVSKISKSVTKFKEGELVGVGVLSDSCRSCISCKEGLEQFCPDLMLTYDSKDKKHGGITFGGYSKSIVVDDAFVLKIPENIKAAGAAPLLCAGVTTWSPIRHWNVKAGDNIGVVGLGGLGHMAIKFSHALGAKVTMITTSKSKGEDAKKLGASNILISTDTIAMKKSANQFDFIINTIPTSHDLNPYVSLLKRDATMVLLGVLEPVKPELDISPLIFNRKRIAGSFIGGLKETQEMLNFCGKHNITADIELVSIKDINEAYERMIKGDVKYRFVIDMQTLF